MTERTWLRTLGVVSATSVGTLAVLLATAVRNDQLRADAARGPAVVAAAATGQFGGGFNPALNDADPPAVRFVPVVKPPTAKAAAVWLALGKPLDMPFPRETPLEDVLKYIKKSTESEHLNGGIPIYVDPAGLTEAEKTMTSPVSMDVVGIPATTSLRLMLRQLGLGYEVTDEGLLVITSEANLQERDPMSALLVELQDLRREVAALRAGQTGNGMMDQMGGGMMGGPPAKASGYR
jgi:hypothetical protein